MANERIYEVMFIVEPNTAEEDVTKLVDGLQKIITDQGGNIVKNEAMGRRQLAYPIGKTKEGIYHLFEIEGSGQEIAELERRMRVSDAVMRYISVRVDEDRRRAEKFKTKRINKAARRPTRGGKNNNAEATDNNAAA